MDGAEFFEERFRAQNQELPGSMEALWAELPASRSANPDLWDQAMEFWKGNFELSAQFGEQSKLLVNIPLLKSLKWELVHWDQRDLLRVLEHLLTEKVPSIQSLESFVAKGFVGYFSGWISSWISRVVGPRRDPLGDECAYIVVPRLKVFAQRLQTHWYDQADAAAVPAVFLRSAIVRESGSTAHDVDLALAWLGAQGQCVTAPMAGDTVVKFAAPHDGCVAKLTPRDMDIAKLQHAAAVLDAQLARLEQDLDVEQRRIVEHVAGGRRGQALAGLRRRKDVEKVYAQRCTMRDHVARVLLAAQAGETHAKVLAALRSGTDLLKAHHQAAPDVHDVMESVAQALDNQRALDDALRIDVLGREHAGPSDSELLAELVSMESDDASLVALELAPPVPQSGNVVPQERHRQPLIDRCDHISMG